MLVFGSNGKKTLTLSSLARSRNLSRIANRNGMASHGKVRNEVVSRPTHARHPTRTFLSMAVSMKIRSRLLVISVASGKQYGSGTVHRRFLGQILLMPQCWAGEKSLTFVPFFVLSKKDTVIGSDLLHPRELATTGDLVLEVLLDLFLACELLGSWPQCMRTALISMIPTPPSSGGGHRPIAILTTAYRSWCRQRIDVARKWERDYHRTFFLSGQGQCSNQPSLAASIFWRTIACCIGLDDQHLFRRLQML